MGRLDNQVAWISGAAQGIGAGAAKLFAEEGAGVVVADINESAGRQLVEEINAEGHKAIFAPCNVTQAHDVQESIETAVKEFGGLHILVNNAGIVEVGMLHEADESQWSRVMDTNVKSIYYSLKYSFDYLSRNDRSYIVNVGSISSYVAQDRTPIYTTTKGAILQLTRSIAVDYARYAIRCNCVCPGITDTPLLRRHIESLHDPEEHLATRLRRVPINRIITPRDIGKSILYFCCEDSAGVTGTSVIVDGGYLAAAEWDAASTERK
jgi:NAD(P)-dependent dehydrogenase (short-subunit alcohol dehydrogenase family)